MTVIYRKSTGVIEFSSDQPMSEAALNLVLKDSALAAIDGTANPDIHHIVKGCAVEKPPREKSHDELVREVKSERAQKLYTSDWTQMPDVELKTKKEWADYRQELRDITKQSGYPSNIKWPKAP